MTRVTLRVIGYQQRRSLRRWLVAESTFEFLVVGKAVTGVDLVLLQVKE